MSLHQRSTVISEYRSKALVQEWFWHGTRHESVGLRLDSVERIIGGLFLFYVWTVQLGWNNIFQRTTEGDFPSGMASGGAPHGFLAWMSEWSQATEDGSQLQKARIHPLAPWFEGEAQLDPKIRDRAFHGSSVQKRKWWMHASVRRHMHFLWDWEAICLSCRCSQELATHSWWKAENPTAKPQGQSFCSFESTKISTF